MNPADLQIRIAKKLVNGRGGMTITQADLDVLLNCGAYEKLCQAAIEFNQCRKRNAPSRSTPVAITRSTSGQTEQTSILSGMTVPQDVNAEVARALATLPRPSKPLTGSILVKTPAPPAGGHTNGQAG